MDAKHKEELTVSGLVNLPTCSKNRTGVQLRQQNATEDGPMGIAVPVRTVNHYNEQYEF